MNDYLQFALLTTSAVFFVIDPLATVPLFLSFTARFPEAQRRRIALRATLAAWITLCVFALAGGVIFQMFGISLGAFKVAGGFMLLLMAVDMMRAQASPTRSTEAEQTETMEREDIAIVPLAIPMLAGPGAIATVMVFMSRAHWQVVPTLIVFGAVTVTCVIAWLLYRSAAKAEKFVPKSFLHAAERVMGLLLAAVAVEFIASGVRDLIARTG